MNWTIDQFDGFGNETKPTNEPKMNNGNEQPIKNETLSGNEPEMNRRNELEMNAGNEPEMNRGVEMNQETSVEMNPLIQSGFATITNKQHKCYLPQHRPKPLVAFDIVDKLRDLESNISCEILDQLIANFEEVQTYLIEEHIYLLMEEE